MQNNSSEITIATIRGKTYSENQSNKVMHVVQRLYVQARPCLWSYDCRRGRLYVRVFTELILHARIEAKKLTTHTFIVYWSMAAYVLDLKQKNIKNKNTKKQYKLD